MTYEQLRESITQCLADERHGWIVEMREGQPPYVNTSVVHDLMLIASEYSTSEIQKLAIRDLRKQGYIK